MSSLKGLEADSDLYDADEDDVDLKESKEKQAHAEPEIVIGKAGAGKDAKDSKESKGAKVERKETKRPLAKGRVSFHDSKDGKETKRDKAADAKDAKDAEGEGEEEAKSRDLFAIGSMSDVLDRITLNSSKLRGRLIDYILETAKSGSFCFLALCFLARFRDGI